MARAAVARALISHVPAVTRGRFAFAAATDADEEEVRQLLRVPLAGDISISLEREPDSRIAAGIEGDVHDTIVARDLMTGTIAGIASYSVRSAFVNGRLTPLGYLGQLRVARGLGRSRDLFDGGFEYCRALHERGDARVYLLSVVAGNRAASRLLVNAQSRSAPRFRSAGALTTVVLPRLRSTVESVIKRVRRTKASGPGTTAILEGSAALLPEIVACLQRNGARRQFAPLWTAEDFASTRTRDLAPKDFLTAVRGSRVVGCIARWDQRRFKQTVVRGYASGLGRWRPALNTIAPLIGMPHLPQVGERLEFTYLSHLAVDQDDGEVACALVAAARGRLPRDVHYAVVGVPSRSSMLRAIRDRFSHREYCSDLYVGYWPDGEEIARRLDERLPHPEVAVL